MFDNVFVDPAAWQGFRRSGHWPDGAMLVMEARGAASHGSINRNGQYQIEALMGAEVPVRDTRRFKGGWGFFILHGAAPAKLVDDQAQCYACHQANAAGDTTFV